MAKIDHLLTELMELDGAKAVAIVDYSSGMLMGSMGGGLDLDMAAAGNTEVIKAKIKTMKMMGLTNTKIIDIIITLTDQFHIIRPLDKDSQVFLYYVLNSKKANLAMARKKLQIVEASLVI